MKTSMSHKGNCFDNAPMESSGGSLKNEVVRHRRFKCRAGAQAAITECVEIFCNRQHALLRTSARKRWQLETRVSTIVTKPE